MTERDMTERNNREVMSDDDLDQLLQTASEPPRPLGAEQRMMKRIAAVGNAPASRLERTGRFAWLAGGFPLAASLALGLYLGAQGLSIDTIGQTDLAGYDDQDFSGIGDAETVAEEDLI